jgi:hypothetical protein
LPAFELRGLRLTVLYMSSFVMLRQFVRAIVDASDAQEGEVEDKEGA